MLNSDKQMLFLTILAVIFVVYGLVKLFQFSIRRKTRKEDQAATKPSSTSSGSHRDTKNAYWFPQGPYDDSDYALGGLTPALSAMMPVSAEKRETLTRALRNAGDYAPHAWENFSAKWYLLLMLPLLICGALLAWVPAAFETPVIIIMVVSTALAWALPSLILRSQASERLREISNAMPDMLDLLNMCAAQGMTISSSFQRVGKDLQPVYPALSKEMSIVTEQAKVGSLTQALENFQKRVDLPEVASFSNLLVQTEKLGTSVSEALEEYSEGMRQSMRQRADEKANSAAFKLLFPTVLCLMPAVYLFLLGPSIVELGRFFDQGATESLRVEIPERLIE